MALVFSLINHSQKFIYSLLRQRIDVGTRPSGRDLLALQPRPTNI